MTIADAVAGAQVVVARFVSLGSVDVGAPGQQYWHDAEADVDQALSGTLKGRVRVAYTVQVIPASIAESPPVVGEATILFVRGNRVVKMLPATDANIAATKTAIGAR
jgi:hypothetical protein